MYGAMVKFTGTVVENLKCVTEQTKDLEFKSYITFRNQRKQANAVNSC